MLTLFTNQEKKRKEDKLPPIVFKKSQRKERFRV